MFNNYCNLIQYKNLYIYIYTQICENSEFHYKYIKYMFRHEK